MLTSGWRFNWRLLSWVKKRPKEWLLPWRFCLDSAFGGLRRPDACRACYAAPCVAGSAFKEGSLAIARIRSPLPNFHSIQIPVHSRTRTNPASPPPNPGSRSARGPSFADFNVWRRRQQHRTPPTGPGPAASSLRSPPTVCGAIARRTAPRPSLTRTRPGIDKCADQASTECRRG